MKNCVKFFTKKQKKSFFQALETESQSCKTPYQKKCAIRNEAMFKLMYYCALRVSETILLEMNHFNHSNDIYCTRLKGGKNNTLHIIDDDVLSAIKKHIKYNHPKKYLFENMRDQKPISRKTLDKLMKKYCTIANLEDYEKHHCHTLRHTRAIDLLESGLSIYEVQFWLGHKCITNTEIYLQFTSKQQNSMYKKLKKQHI